MTTRSNKNRTPKFQIKTPDYKAETRRLAQLLTISRHTHEIKAAKNAAEINEYFDDLIDNLIGLMDPSPEDQTVFSSQINACRNKILTLLDPMSRDDSE